ncbi:ferrous iron transport protein B [Gynuella sp.]|uniref:ferrous iron transport protein B n=1 Tax=Gynuella sp. TaxID=2969146 RepID=UPI003D0EE115
MSLSITLVGNPNTGKTTLFNKLAGTRQKVGNWTGVTVECKTGFFSTNERRVDMTDLPGVYSLGHHSGGMDEALARKFLTEDSYDVIVNVVDATNLKRNLKLTAELVGMQRPMIVVLTMTDLAEKIGSMPDVAQLSANLGIPVIDGNRYSASELQKHLADVALEVKQIGKPVVMQSVSHWLSGVIKNTSGGQNITEKVDSIVLHPWFGIPIFLFAMYTMFALAIGIGSLFIDPIDMLAGYWFVELPSHWLMVLGTPDWMITVFAKGLGGGLQLVAGFIPVIGFLYLCLSILEDSGYMARAAFIVDRMMSAIGLPGQAFIPLLLGFGCNVPSIMATRSLTNIRQRMLTMAMAPFMSCGARLAVYAMFVSVFFRDNAELLVFALYLLGILVAVGTAWIFRKQLFKDVRASSFMEMPHYHRPRWSNVGISSWHKIRGFVMRAGKTIVLVSAVLTVLNSVPSWRSEQQEGRPSALAEVGQVIAPVFTPIGMGEDNWPAAVGIFTGILAKEAVVGTMEALYSGETEDASEFVSPLTNVTEAAALLGSNLLGIVTAVTDPLGFTDVAQAEAGVVDTPSHSKMVELFAGWQGALAYLVFILLYTPCAAAIGALVKEGGKLWTLVVAGWTTSVAYAAAVYCFQLLTFARHPLQSFTTLMLVTIWMVAFVVLLKMWVRPKINRELIAVG